MTRPLTAPEAESGVIGALMIKPDLCETIGAFLGREHFADQDLGALYGLCLIAKAKEMVPDAVTLSELCPFLPSGNDTLQAAARVQMSVTSAANCEVYARIVIERYKARQLQDVAGKIHELANSRGKIRDQIAAAQALVMDLMSADDTADVISLREALHPVFDEMDDRFNGRKAMGLDFGLSDLDKIIKGLRPGNLAIIAGRPGTGKTVLGVNLAVQNATRKGKQALIFSLEMSASELAKRALAAESGISQGLLESGEALKHEDMTASMTAAVARLGESGVRICDKGGLTLSRILAISRFQHRADPLDLIVIDYLGLINPDPGNKHQNRNQELGAISRSLKALAKELGIPVVALAQLNRGIESRTEAKPRMSDLRDSGEIEQDADVIIMAHRDSHPDRGGLGITDIEVVKCRHASTGHAILAFQGDLARFVAVADPSRYEQAPEDAAPQKSIRAKLRAAQ